MNVIFVYRQKLYTEIDLSHSIFESLQQALPNMFLTITGTAKVTQTITNLNALNDDFPTWKYFVEEFEQYMSGNKRVSVL